RVRIRWQAQIEAGAEEKNFKSLRSNFSRLNSARKCTRKLPRCVGRAHDPRETVLRPVSVQPLRAFAGFSPSEHLAEELLHFAARPEFAQALDFPVQSNTGSLKNAGSHGLSEELQVVAGRAAGIDHEVAMHGR